MLERIVGTPQNDADIYLQLLNGRDRPQEFVSGRIVHVCSQLGPGGTERQIAQTICGQIGQPAVESITVLCKDLRGRNYDFFAPEIRKSGVTVREIRAPLLWQRGAEGGLPEALHHLSSALPATVMVRVAHLYYEFKELRPEVVHAWLDRPSVLAGLAAVLAGVPRIVLSGRNINPTHFVDWIYYLQPAYQALAQSCSVGLINNSLAGADDYAKWLGLPRKRFSVIYNGIDQTGRRRLPDHKIRHIRASWGLPVEAKLIESIFRFRDEKRPLLWLEVASRIASKNKNVYFKIFGEGPLLKSMLGWIQAHSLTDRIDLAGLTQDTTEVLSACDLFLLVSRAEGTPNVLLEAQLAGVPVVVTAAGGSAEAFLPGQTGVLLNTEDPDEIAEQTLAALEDASLATVAGEAGPRFVAERFGLERMIDETLACYGGTFLTVQRNREGGGGDEWLSPRRDDNEAVRLTP